MFNFSIAKKLIKQNKNQLLNILFHRTEVVQTILMNILQYRDQYLGKICIQIVKIKTFNIIYFQQYSTMPRTKRSRSNESSDPTFSPSKHRKQQKNNYKKVTRQKREKFVRLLSQSISIKAASIKAKINYSNAKVISRKHKASKKENIKIQENSNRSDDARLQQINDQIDDPPANSDASSAALSPQQYQWRFYSNPIIPIIYYYM